MRRGDIQTALILILNPLYKAKKGSIYAYAYKDCTENGTWWVNPVTGSEWTNYTTCVPKQDFHTVVYVGLACNILSLLLLIPACSIFLGIRQLRLQKRIKLHICLFISFIFASLVTVTWDVAVYLDRLQNERENTANVLFLANILKILCSKLQMHPNEPSNYRKALKATFVLVPLFGIQQFLVIYRPLPGTTLSFTYEILQKVIQNTQGATVAFIFCFFNGEVYTYMRNCIGSHINIGTSSKHHNRDNSMSSATQVTSYTSSARRNTKCKDNFDKSYMPLSTSSTTQELTTPTNGHVTFSV
ncbi:CALRL-like protein [Mya arenaria]|uniref:CALRL-like protein n=1 Tax=Mya arenaria TaxID=6604 RepID=A0ABY7DB68_MYAAR|nr:CALRL-like protein [Mya arenaria]